MVARLLFLMLVASPAMAQSGRVIGRVVDARGGEALSNVAVSLENGPKSVTGPGGTFEIPAIAPGSHVLVVATVGYHVVKRPFEIAGDETRQFEIVLSPDTLRRTDAVVVTAGPFETLRQDSPAAISLSGNDVKNLASVLADDPLRAVQSLPGVSSNNDFEARFSLRGASYNRIGLYLDDVMLHQPFQMLAGQNITGSGAAFNGGMVENLELHEGAYPERFGDRSAGILDVHTREGGRDATSVRAEASMSNAGATAEGRLGPGKRGSWLVGARKSYLQYIVGRITTDTSLVFGLEDVQGRLTYDLTPKNQVWLYLLESYSSLDRSRPGLGINSLAKAGYDYSLVNLGWRWTPAANLAVVSHAAWMREKYDNLNPNGLRLGDGFYGEWVANSAATWNQTAAATFDAGFSMRRLRDEGVSAQFQSLTAPPRLLDSHRGTGVLGGGFAQESWTGMSGRVHLSAGLRGDQLSTSSGSTATPQASAALILSPATRIQVGWGQYSQFPELSVLTSPAGSIHLEPIRSNHVIAALEQRLGERLRLRAEFYNRADRDLPWQPFAEPRLPIGAASVPTVNNLYRNSLRGYSRGVEVFLQRSSANRFNGWVSYAYGKTGMRDGATSARFAADYDQTHTVNIYGGYRLRPSVNLSVHSSYGSGFPIPGYLRLSGSTYFLGPQRNQLRLAYYQRTDLRINKSWTRRKSKITLYGELVNMTNRTNRIFDSLNSYNTKTGQTSVTVDSMLPILPSVGIVFEK